VVQHGTTVDAMRDELAASYAMGRQESTSAGRSGV